MPAGQSMVHCIYVLDDFEEDFVCWLHILVGLGLLKLLLINSQASAISLLIL